jgi:hypothetical protein
MILSMAIAAFAAALTAPALLVLTAEALLAPKNEASSRTAPEGLRSPKLSAAAAVRMSAARSAAPNADRAFGLCEGSIRCFAN